MAQARLVLKNERGAQAEKALFQPFTSPIAKAVVCIALGLQAIAIAADAPAPAVPRFIEETDASGLQSRFEGEGEFLVGGGVATFDCDGDGLPEVYVTAGVNKAKFYRNRSARGGPIKLQEERSGLELTNAIGAYPLDIDGDGNTDLVVLRVGEVQIFRGLGNCKFQRANEAWSVQTSNGWHTAFSATWESGQNWPTLAIGTCRAQGWLDQERRAVQGRRQNQRACGLQVSQV